MCNSLRKTLRGVDRWAILQYQFAIGSVFALLVMAVSRQEIIREVSILPLIITILYAALQVGLGNLLLYGFQNFDVNIGTVILASELFFATVLGYLFFREIPTNHELIGGTLIFCASILSSVDLSGVLRRMQAFQKT
jgi:drug/metabolite transporter (DMT)-like permease